MSTIPRTLRNIRKVGIKVRGEPGRRAPDPNGSPPPQGNKTLTFNRTTWFRCDTKAGTYMGKDRAGNKYFENGEELPLRTRWVEYAKHDFDAAHIEPGWHAWMSYVVDAVPGDDPLLTAGTRKFEPALPKPNYTQTPGAFKTYNTCVPPKTKMCTKSKLTAWQPVAAPRS
ncbi:NADH:ubiquinone oxidoreductase subunit [Cordyceps militaris]|uniref:NADH dehydrogenase [ubiquinone] 1 alpha subcomplex subunit n=1 Tax=Cordyceps militaris TaxID=73501 RepID=A0A2H4S6A3_CORMI|nr:NADH:ubiquinone oxidoreductase subunit [Cordyceps militaris]